MGQFNLDLIFLERIFINKVIQPILFGEQALIKCYYLVYFKSLIIMQIVYLLKKSTKYYLNKNL